MSAGLLYLTGEDFTVKNTQAGKVLCHDIPDYSIVFFYSNNCNYCKGLIPIFKRLPGTLVGCQFAMLNVDRYKECIIKSKDTISPLRYVPYIVLYINGQPFMAYNGEHTENGIKNFIIDVSTNLQKKQQFSKDKVQKPQQSEIPTYSIGKPICGNDKVCYLEFGDAYHKK